MERSLEITASRLDSVANTPNSTNSTCSKSPLLLGTCGLVGHVYVCVTLRPCKNRWSRTNVPFSARNISCYIERSTF